MSHISNEKSVYPRNGSNRKKILLLTVRPFLSDAVADYALHLAARLEHELLVLIVDTQWEGARFEIDAAKTRRSILQKAKATGSECSLIVKQGDLGLAVEGSIVTKSASNLPSSMKRSTAKRSIKSPCLCSRSPATL